MTHHALIVVLLLAGCASSEERVDRARPAPDPAATPAPSSEGSAATKPTAQTGTLEPTAGVRPPRTPGAPDECSGAAAPSDARGGALAPPATPGAQAVRLTGCVTAADERAARRFVPQSAPSETPPGLAVIPVPGGVRVVHRLTHACCLKAEIASRLEGERLTVTERLRGEPCRCQCASTLETAVAVPSGRTRVTVVLERPRSDPERVHDASVDVP